MTTVTPSTVHPFAAADETTTTNSTSTNDTVARALPDPPSDGITGLEYVSTDINKTLLACTSWDGTVRIYDTQQFQLQVRTAPSPSPWLSLATSGKNKVYVGGLNGSIQYLDLKSSKPSTLIPIGNHTTTAEESSSAAADAACSCLSVIDDCVLASAGWHKKVHLWDTRQAPSDSNFCEELPGKAFDMDYSPNTHVLAVATSGRHNVFFDIRMAKANFVLDRESSLKFQTRCMKFLYDGHAIVLGSIEGRVAVEYLDELSQSSSSSSSQQNNINYYPVKPDYLKGKKKYAFKCHRRNDRVYPVNQIAIHPIYGTFVTGGADGTVVTWDGLHKKKVANLCSLPTSISALAYYSPAGDGAETTELAIASSYTFEEGEREHYPKDEIYIRKVLDSECQPKQVLK